MLMLSQYFGKKKDSNKRYCADNNSYVEAF